MIHFFLLKYKTDVAVRNNLPPFSLALMCCTKINICTNVHSFNDPSLVFCLPLSSFCRLCFTEGVGSSEEWMIFKYRSRGRIPISLISHPLLAADMVFIIYPAMMYLNSASNSRFSIPYRCGWRAYFPNNEILSPWILQFPRMIIKTLKTINKIMPVCF